MWLSQTINVTPKVRLFSAAVYMATILGLLIPSQITKPLYEISLDRHQLYNKNFLFERAFACLRELINPSSPNFFLNSKPCFSIKNTDLLIVRFWSNF